MSALNSKIRGKKIVFSSEDDENLISTALSIIWEKTNKKVESCYFDKDKKINSNISDIQLEHYKFLCEKYKNKCADLQNELQKCSIPDALGITEVETSKSRVMVPASQVPAADMVVLIESRTSEESQFQPSSSSLHPSKTSSGSQSPTVSSLVESQLSDNSKGAIDETLGISKGKKKEIMEDIEKDRENTNKASEDSKSMEAKKIYIIANIDLFANNDLSFAAAAATINTETDATLTKTLSTTVQSLTSSPESSSPALAELQPNTVCDPKKANYIKEKKEKNSAPPPPSPTPSSNSIVRKRVEISSEEDDSDTDTIDDELNSAQMSLFNKGKRLREILQTSSCSKEVMRYSKTSDAMSDLSSNDSPIEINDEDSAKNRILQWQRQESRCDKIIMAAESFQLLHLVALAKIYDDVLHVGERLSLDPEKNIKNVKKWVVKVVRSVLNINSKAEQRNRLGYARLQNLFKKGITSTQLVQAGCRKCDFFAKQEYYDVFLSQVQLDSLGSNSSSISPRKKRKV